MNPNATHPHTPGEFGEPPAPAAPVRGPVYYLRRGLKALASLQLTIVLFVLGILLIFFGTMAQIDNGIWTVVDKYFASFLVWVPGELFHKFLTVFWKEQFPPGESAWTWSFPFPAGFAIGGAMLVNLLAAHATRFRLTWKRAGILLIHSGLVLLFVGEFITRHYAIEQRMTIDERKSVSYAEDNRNYELAFVDRSDPNADTVVTIPGKMLKKAEGRITHPDLPVDVEVVEYMTNSAIVPAEGGRPNPADRGIGTGAVAVKQPEVSGVDPKQTIDLPSAYVRLYKKGTDESLGTRLVSLSGNLRFGPDEVEVDGKKYEMMLRFKRYYKPYRVHLDKFSFDRYTGTEKAKNYSSDVRVFVPGNDQPVRQQRISMNEPMRYAGETFYQSSFDDKTEKTTVLQVVRNPGWLNLYFFEVPIDYIGCAVVGVGLLVHFLISLVLFLRRLKASERVVLTGFPKYFPLVVMGVMALYLLSVFGRMAPPKEPVDLDAVGRMTVVEGGREKPLDTVARVHLRMVSGREEIEDEKGKKVPAIQWYLDLLASGPPQQRGPVWRYKFIRVDNEAVLRALKLENRDGFRYSLEEIAPGIDVIQKRMAEVEKKVGEGKKLDTDDAKFKELRDRLQSLMELAVFGGPLLLPPENNKDWSTVYEFRLDAQIAGTTAGILDAQKWLDESKKLDQLTPAEEQKLVELTHGIDLAKMNLDADKRKALMAETVRQVRIDPRETAKSLRARMKDRDVPNPRILATLDAMLRDQSEAVLALLPEDRRKAAEEVSRKTTEAVLATRPTNATWEKLVAAYRDKRPNDFSAAVAEYRTATAGIADRKEPHNFAERLVYAPFNAIGRTRTETTYNRFAPFYQCTGLYVIALVLTLVGFTQHAAGRPHWGAALRRSALLVLLLALVVHTVGLLARMYLMERVGVFVTNLYSSAIFIGLGCVALGIVLELIFRLSVGNILAAVLGAATCIVAHNIATDDTLEMMQAVLDTNFWLATHVTTVTLGYTATFVAGALGALYVLQMLGAVVRDSFESTGEPTVGALAAFGAAATGVVGIPLFLLWFATNALIKFEVLPSILLQGIYWLTFACGLIYALSLMLLRVASEGVDAHGKPVAGRLPALAKPVAALALTPERGKVFGQMVYGVVCFATLLSFVGTVLGGIWADQSWGRFWGWDPKENGAVLIVLWNALILHARWAGLVKDRGMAVLAVFGNVMTAWSWFGTNQLQLGLHSYGFDTRLADGCFNFWVCMLFIIGWGLIPKQFWASAARRPAPVVPPATNAAATAPPPPAGPDGAPRSPNGSANGQPPQNGHPNGAPNGQPRRDKGKKHGKRR